VTPKNGSKNAQNGSQQRTRLWPDSYVASKLTFEQRQLLPSQMKREAGGQGEFLLCPQGKAASPRFMGVIVLGGTERPIR
jgi:hypothetical protein